MAHMTATIFWVIFGTLVVSMVIYTVVVYNRLIRLTKNITEAWSNVAAALQRRHELIPALATIVGSSMSYEREVQASITALRMGDVSSINQHESIIGGSLMAVREAFPDIDTDQQTVQLIQSLVQVENSILGERLMYNRAVAQYNRVIAAFPPHMLARSAGFIAVDFLDF